MLKGARSAGVSDSAMIRLISDFPAGCADKSYNSCRIE